MSESPIMKLPLEILQHILLDVILEIEVTDVKTAATASEKLRKVCPAFRSAMRHVQLWWLRNCAAHLLREHAEIKAMADRVYDEATRLRALFPPAVLASLPQADESDDSASQAAVEEPGTHAG